MRTFFPSRVSKRTRVGLPVLGSSIATFERAAALRARTMPPCGLRLARLGWRRATLMPETTHLAVLRHRLRHLAVPALVLAGQDDDLVALLDLRGGHYSTSGARLMIFMCFFARSSRTTGPKIRVPIGSCVVVDQHRRVRIEADGRAVGTMDVLGGADDHGLVDVALLHAAPRRGFLDGDDDDVAHAGEAPLGAAQHLDALDALGAAIVGDLKVGLHLDHRSNSFFTSTGLGDQFKRASTFSASATSVSASASSAFDFLAGFSSAGRRGMGVDAVRAPSRSSASRSAASPRCGRSRPP